MTVRRFGIPFTLKQRDVWIEDAAAGLLSTSSELDMNGQLQRTEAHIEEGNLRVEVWKGEQGSRHSFSVDSEPAGSELLGIYTASRLVEQAFFASSPQTRELSYHLFSPETLQVEEIKVRLLGPGEIEDSGGRIFRGILLEESSTALPGTATRAVYSGEGRFLYSRTPVGLALEIVAVSPDQLEAEEALVFDVAGLSIPVRGLDSLPAELRLSFKGEAIDDLQEAIASARTDLGGGGLQVAEKRSDPEALTVILKRMSLNESLQSRARKPEQDVSAYLRGGFHLDLEDPRLEELLSRCPSAGEQETVLRCLEELVYDTIENKSLAYGFAGVDEILAARAGDCTEHALLLTALLRRRGIPSRIAYGMLLTEMGLIGHAWTEVYAAGRWHWMDPSFPGSTPYALKIRLGVLDPAEPAWAQMSLSLLRMAAGLEAEVVEVRADDRE